MDQLGDYMKLLERRSETRAEKGLPLCARLDGRAFHTFTRGLKRPYDERLSTLMRLTLSELIKATDAYLGYTQSDEISLVWYVPDESCSQYLFDGRVQKMCSILASIATGTFQKNLGKMLPEKSHLDPIFDCRVWQVPTLNDAALMFKWRELDAIKNSISMAAQAHFSHSQLHKVSGEEKKKMLREIGKAWENEPEFFRKGTYLKRQKVEIELGEEELSKIPECHRPVGTVTRSVITEVYFPDLNTVEDLRSTLFGDLS